MSKPTSVKDLSYEQAFQELEELVAKLESGDLPLEQALAIFERGQAISKRCNDLLEKAELKLRKLVPDSSGGYDEVEFEEGVA